MVSYHGKGTLVVRTADLKEGDLVVRLRYRNKHRQGEEWTEQEVLMKDGFGTVSTFEYYGVDESNRAQRPAYEFAVRGYSRLQPATVAIVE